MVLNPQNFLEIANQLFQDRHYQYESGWRTVISRAYYASFLGSMKRLEELGGSFSDVDRIHQEVIERMMEMNSAIANKLETLRRKRVDADYKMKALILKGECSNLLRLAELVLRDVATLERR